MNSPTPLTVSVVLPGQGRIVEAFGEHMTFLQTGEQTGGRYTAFVSVTPPGGGPPPHWHEFDDEWFYVVEGAVEFFKDGGWTGVPVGTSVFIPRGTVHAFRNVGDFPLKQLIHTAPSGFETFFTRCAAEFDRDGGGDMARILEIGAEHGIHFA